MKTRKVLAILALIAILSLSFATLAGAAELTKTGTTPTTAYSEGYDDGYYESAPTVGPSLIWLPISLIFGAIVASAMNGSEKASMKTVREQTKANFYFKQGGLNLNVNQNIFLYKRTERTPLNQDQNMNGGMGPGQGGGATVSTVSEIQEKFPAEYKAAQELRQKDPAAYREKMRDLQKKLSEEK